MAESWASWEGSDSYPDLGGHPVLYRDNGIEMGDHEFHRQCNLIEHDGRRLRVPAIARYNDERQKLWNRWIGALKQFDLPAHVLWADLGSFTLPSVAEALHTDITEYQLSWLKGVTHYLMPEEPQR